MTSKKGSKPESTRTVLSRLEKVENVPLQITASFYGRSGTGKTTLLSTFPKPLLLVDIQEHGTDSISDVKGAYRLRAESWSDIEDFYWFIRDSAADGKAKFKTVGVDSVTNLQNLALAEAAREEGRDPGGHLTKNVYGNAAGKMKTWLGNYRDLAYECGIHVVFISHDRIHDVEEEEGDDTGSITPEVGPRVMPSVASHLNGIVNVIGNTFIREKVTKVKGQVGKKKRRIDYCLRLGPHPYYTTKIRVPKAQAIKVPTFMIDPSFDKIVSIIDGSDEQGVDDQTK